MHLGTQGSNAAAFLAFLREKDFDTLYVVGDLIDIWSLRRGIYWPQEHNDVIQKLLRKARKGTRIIYIPGNHDEFLSSLLGAYGAITIQKHAMHITADGRRILVMHGHELDTVVQNIEWLALVGDLGYQFLLALNPLVNSSAATSVSATGRSAGRSRPGQGRGQLHRRLRGFDRSLCRAIQCPRRSLWSHPQPDHSAHRRQDLLQLRRLG